MPRPGGRGANPEHDADPRSCDCPGSPSSSTDYVSPKLSRIFGGQDCACSKPFQAQGWKPPLARLKPVRLKSQKKHETHLRRASASYQFGIPHKSPEKHAVQCVSAPCQIGTLGLPLKPASKIPENVPQSRVSNTLARRQSRRVYF